jgi:DNA primase
VAEQIINIAEEIKSRCDIVDVIGRTVVLKRAGSSYKGLCPFHSEKTPSFNVSERTGTYRCFGCGEHGDVITFYEKIYNMNFLDAAEKLAQELGIDWKPGGSYGGDNKSDKYYEINQAAARYYYDKFWEKENPAYVYMKERGLSDKTMRTFGIGYAAGSDGLLAHFNAAGTDLALAGELGLVKAMDSRYRDKYFNRVVFPYINVRNKVIGFSARALGDGKPKYINSDASPVFKKRDNLYALSVTAQAIRAKNKAILVEGPMDAIALYEKGFENVAASLGTALTEGQAARLRKMCEDVLIAYDGDAAGVKAAIAAVDILRKAGLKVKVLSVPQENAKDPDEYIRKFGHDAFEKLIAKASPGPAFKLNNAVLKYDLKDPNEASAFIEEAVKLLDGLPDYEKDIYAAKLEKVTGVSVGVIRMELGITADKPVRANTEAARRSSKPEDKAALTQLQKNILRLIIDTPSLLTDPDKTSLPKGVSEELTRIFTTKSYARIFMEATALAAKNKEDEFSVDTLSDALEEEDRAALKEIMKIPVGDNPEKQFRDCLKKGRILDFDKQMKDLLEDIDAETDEEERAMKLKAWQDVLSKKQQLERDN